MSNYHEVKKELKNYISARTPLIIVDSPERERVERVLGEVSRELSAEILYYTDSKQVCNFTSQYSVDADNDPLLYIADTFKKKRNSTFAFGDVKRIGGDNTFSREVINILYLAKESNCSLILITADVVWPRLAQFGMLTTLDYPDDNERKIQIEAFLDVYKSRYCVEWDAMDILQAVTLLRGFSEMQIENILATTIIANNGLKRTCISELTNQKSRLYSSVPCIQKVNINPNLEVSGLEGLKAWLDQKRLVFFASDNELKTRDLSAPKGILLAGVPGCGKSFSAKMVAQKWGLPLFRFDIGTIYDKWVGESERKMKEALQYIDNVSPCVLWIDEIEKALSVSDTGNDTGKRILGQFLFWLQESTSRVFLVATANEISQLPFELFRKGRFSEIFYLDLPNPIERKHAIELYVAKSLQLQISSENLSDLIDWSEGFSYSDIEYAIKDIAQLALIEPERFIDHHEFEVEFKSIIPISKSNPDMVRKVKEWGKERAVSASNQLGGRTRE